MRILIVEDDFISRQLLRYYLEPHGYCDIAVNGLEAVDAVTLAMEKGLHYDLICLDIMMPELDGNETLTRIRALEKEHDLKEHECAKIIMTTALEDYENIRDSYRAQADGYLIKPLQRALFLNTLRDAGLEVGLIS